VFIESRLQTTHYTTGTDEAEIHSFVKEAPIVLINIKHCQKSANTVNHICNLHTSVYRNSNVPSLLFCLLCSTKKI